MKRAIVITVLLAALGLAGFTSPALQPAAAQGGAVWSADFYNNGYLLGKPVFSTQYGSLDLNWGASSPGPGVNSDNFTARLATDTHFTAGTYRFYLLADDAVQLWVDFPPNKQPALTTFNAPQPGQLLSVDVPMTEGTHHIQVDFKELTGNAYLYVRWANLATNPTPPSFPVPIQVATGPWTAQYFNNQALSGAPVLTQAESAVAHDWGTGAPAGGIPADYFSVRWTSAQYLSGGTYQVQALADDGVRVWVDGSLVIDQWHTASGQTYLADVNLGAGPHSFMVEYYEATGNASINVQINQVGAVPPPVLTPPPSPTGTTVTVLAYRLNVRNAPSAASGQIIAQVSRGQIFPVLGVSSDGGWFEIDDLGVVGWVSATYVQINNEQAVPITGGQPGVTGYTLTSLASLNVRRGPGLGNVRVGALRPGQTAQVIGRNAGSTWWEITYDGVTGWVYAAFSELQPGADVNLIPVTG
ncbi:MAG TPA: PA14 domain-containing protein [Aggregatilineaceae bacterium]|nr:PA14 domain-containing protein [Aggregatilineaceae bacterium]